MDPSRGDRAGAWFEFVDLCEVTTRDIAPDTAGGGVALVAVGATEQHGPHLPLGTDTLIGQALLAHTRSLAEERAATGGRPPAGRVWVLPPLAYGASDEHASFPGTLSIGARGLHRCLVALAAGIRRMGVPRVVLLSSHGGNSAALDIAALEMRTRYELLVVATSWTRMLSPAAVLPPREAARGIHAGAYETAIMRAHFPHLVRESAVRNFEPADDVGAIPFGGRTGAAWVMEDLHPEGALGDGRLGSIERGRAYTAQAAQVCLDLIGAVLRRPPLWRETPRPSEAP